MPAARAALRRAAITAVKLIDYFPWKSRANNQFKQPQEVVWITDDGTYC
jgi:hypothetical protein